MSTGPRTILIVPEDAYGPMNNCIGIGHALRRRGHRVVFAVEVSWRGRLEPFGFEEDLLEMSAPPERAAGEPAPAAGQYWKDFVREYAPVLRRPPIEQLDAFVRPAFEQLVAGARYCEPQVREIVARTRADVIVQDNVVGFAALQTGDAPYVRILSCNPLEVRGPGVPPAYSGLPLDDRSGWADFRAEYDRTHREVWTGFDAFLREQGAPGLPDLEFVPVSDRLNLYLYPAELDYLVARPLDRTWHRLESSVRTTDAAFAVPEEIAGDASPLIYFSLGSLGSADLALMQGLLAELAQTPYRFIVSMGPHHDQLELGPNMWGAGYLPQTSVIPLVDLVITHGGNNTTTEAMHFGKPMLVLPIFWDQHDNARRVEDRGFGVRVDTYHCTGEWLRSALAQLVGDQDVRARAAAAGRRIRAASGIERAADLIVSAAG